MGSVLRGALALGLVAVAPAISGCPDAVRAEGAGQGGSLVGARMPTTGAPLDLSAEGTLDWMHWGLDGVQGVNRKSGVTSQINQYTLVGTGFDLVWVSCCAQPFSWTDGAPTAEVDDVVGGIAVDTSNARGDGFQLTIAAGPAPRTLRFYAGNWCVRAKLEASLGDASAEPYVDTSWDMPTPDEDSAVYVITYNAASEGQALTIDLTVDDNHCITDDLGEVWLLAATLQDD